MSIESSSLIWKIKRLRSMSIFEIYTRLQRAIELKLFGINSKVKIIEQPKSIKESSELNIQINKTEQQPLIAKIIAEADHYLNHKWLFFGVEKVEEGNINWHYDHINKKIAPKNTHFRLIIEIMMR